MYTAHFSSLCTGKKYKVIYQNVSSGYVRVAVALAIIFFLLLYSTFKIFFNKHRFCNKNNKHTGDPETYTFSKTRAMTKAKRIFNMN